eukprot:1193284-Prorocentrum_minimum.AAC.1
MVGNHRLGSPVLIFFLLLLLRHPPFKSAAYEGRLWVPGPLRGGLYIRLPVDYPCLLPRLRTKWAKSGFGTLPGWDTSLQGPKAIPVIFSIAPACKQDESRLERTVTLIAHSERSSFLSATGKKGDRISAGFMEIHKIYEKCPGYWVKFSHNLFRCPDNTTSSSRLVQAN